MAGYKIKSHRGAAKRFRVTGNGKVKHKAAFGGHLLTSKTSKRMRKITKVAHLNDTDSKMIRTILPYS